MLLEIYVKCAFQNFIWLKQENIVVPKFVVKIAQTKNTVSVVYGGFDVKVFDL